MRTFPLGVHLALPPVVPPAPVDLPTPSEGEARAARLLAEGLLDLNKAAALLPRKSGGGTVGAGSLLRWIISGKAGHKLEAVRVFGSRWHTSAPALARFLAAVTEESGVSSCRR